MLIKHTKGKCKDAREGRLIKVSIYNDTFNGFHSYFFNLFFFNLINSKHLLKLLHTRNNEVKFLIFTILRCFYFFHIFLFNLFYNTSCSEHRSLRIYNLLI